MTKIHFAECVVAQVRPANSVEERVANMHLIATAPELLAACEAALELRQLAFDSSSQSKLDVLSSRAARDRALGIEEDLRLAIAKAKGESP